MVKQRILVCPICGETQPETSSCRVCEVCLNPDGLLFAEGSIGPWWVRDDNAVFRPGMTYDHLVNLVNDGKVELNSILRGPTTRQLWSVARHVQGIAHLLGRCHRCDSHVIPTDRSCGECNAQFLAYRDRNNLGLDSSEPTCGEIDGMSSFLTDTTILNTSSTPLTLKERDATQSSQVDDSVGSPQFRSVQRRLEQSQRSNRILLVSLVIVLVVLAVVIVINMKS
ncbi:MAG: hypothetical protein QF718_08550 [Phycisphaerales bacterium]|jgi:hypothetical protein|nr:hypothetical protein [Phycisphaerales bacterium]